MENGHGPSTLVRYEVHVLADPTYSESTEDLFTVEFYRLDHAQAFIDQLNTRLGDEAWFRDQTGYYAKPVSVEGLWRVAETQLA